jgi:hypothetical protein
VFEGDVSEANPQGAFTPCHPARFQVLELCRGVSGHIASTGLRNPAASDGVILQPLEPQEGLAMAALDDDNDLGPIAVAVVLGTIVAGAFIYGLNRYPTVETALNIPAIERTVPTIVPNQPQF